MTSEQIKLLKESYMKQANRPDGRKSTLAEYMRFCLDGGIDIVTSKDCVIFDDENSMIHAVCINEDMKSQADFPIKIISSDISIVQQLESVLSRENFKDLLNTGFLSSMVSEDKKKFLANFADNIKASALATDAAPYFNTDPKIISKSTSVAKREALPKYVMKLNGVNYTNIKDAINAVTDTVNEITLLSNTSIDETITIDKPVVLDLGGNTLTSTGAKGFEVKANAIFKNGKITNTAINGRCVDTRVGDITLILENMTLESTGSQNVQPLTIGGHDTTPVRVKISNSTIKSADSGYGIIVFVPTELSMAKSTIDGYGALYLKDGSSESIINIANSYLTSTNTHGGTTNDFGTIIFEDSDIDVYIGASSTIESVAIGSAIQSAICLKSKENNQIYIDSTSTLKCNGSNTKLLSGFTPNSTITVTNAASVSGLQKEGYIVENNKVTLKASFAIGNIVYDSVEEAFNNLKDGDTINVFEDTNISSALTVDEGKSVTLNLNGNTMNIDSSISTAFNITDGSLTVEDGNINATGEVFRLGIKGQVDDPDVVLTICDGVNIVSNNDCCVVAYSGTINTAGNLSSKGDYCVIQGTGNDGAINGNVTINILGGSITHTDEEGIAIYHPQNGTLNIYGGIITGSTAVYAKNGSINISGGYLYGNGVQKAFEHSGNGCNTTGDALVLEACDYGTIDVSISGGYFYSYNGKAVAYYKQSDDYKLNAERFISGGTYSSDPTEFCEAGYQANVISSGLYSVV